MAKIVKANIYNSKLFPFENAGHGVFYDSKDLFNDTLIQFLNEIWNSLYSIVNFDYTILYIKVYWFNCNLMLKLMKKGE